jgi:hypothetical protein
MDSDDNRVQENNRMQEAGEIIQVLIQDPGGK